MEKIRNIEFLRFIFILLLIYVHLNFGNNYYLYKNSSLFLCVDFFFILSGFFLFKKTNFNQSYIDFAKKKLLRYMPIIYFVLLINFVLSLFKLIEFNKDNIFLFFNIQNIGLTYNNSDNIGPAWFVSSLFWGLSFYFYLYKCVNKKLFNLIIACIVIFCYSFFIHINDPTIWHFDNVAYVFNSGMLRSLAGIGVGYFIYLICNEYQSVFLNVTKNVGGGEKNNNINEYLKKILITILEVYIFYYILYYICFKEINYQNYILFFYVLFIALIFLFLSKKGWFSQLNDNNISVFIGKYSYTMFIIHILIKDLLSHTIWNKYPEFVINYPYVNIVLYFVILFLCSIIIYNTIEKPITIYLKYKLINKEKNLS